jgi:hypothetical protein
MFVLSVLPVAVSLAAWFTPAAATVQPVCSNSTLSNFKLKALFTDPALNVGLPADGLPITGGFAAVDGLAFYSVLSVVTSSPRVALLSNVLVLEQQFLVTLGNVQAIQWSTRTDEHHLGLLYGVSPR